MTRPASRWRPPSSTAPTPLPARCSLACAGGSLCCCATVGTHSWTEVPAPSIRPLQLRHLRAEPPGSKLCAAVPDCQGYTLVSASPSARAAAFRCCTTEENPHRQLFAHAEDRCGGGGHVLPDLALMSMRLQACFRKRCMEGLTLQLRHSQHILKANAIASLDHALLIIGAYPIDETCGCGHLAVNHGCSSGSGEDMRRKCNGRPNAACLLLSTVRDVH